MSLTPDEERTLDVLEAVSVLLELNGYELIDAGCAERDRLREKKETGDADT